LIEILWSRRSYIRVRKLKRKKSVKSNKMETNTKLRGIIPPMITPLKSIDTLDTEGLERLTEHIVEGGAAGLFVLGTTGEFSSLSYRLRYELVERVCKLADNRIPVLVGITDTSIIESVRLANHAKDQGATAVVAAPPYYYATGQPELLEYYKNLLKMLPLPLYLYNMPVHTKVMIDPVTVRSLAENKGVAGLKDSSSNMAYFRLLQYAIRDFPDFLLYVGPEEMMADAVILGADGGINGGANLFPKLYVNLYNAAVKRDFERITVLQRKVLEVSSQLYTIGKYGSSYLKGLKCALSLTGICDDFMADPFHRFRNEERDKIKMSLDQLNWIELF
jgi:dihydrodipicolinate synthase/N-acetylneuraminate lyase